MGESEAKIPLQCWNREADGESATVDLSLETVVWRYRGEGNANLVVALPREKIIVRMQKCDYDAVLDPPAVREWEVKLKKSVVFYKKVMVPLLGTEFILPPDWARIDEREIADIDRMLLKFRPSFRLSKGVRLGLVTIQPDYTLLPPRKSYKSILRNTFGPPKPDDETNTFCVEIKPKQGWVHQGDRLHPQCTFCLKQYLKLQKKRVTSRSSYCPLDLFSGDRSRMCTALKGLLVTPQNNLKIFLNGNIVYGEGSSNTADQVLERFFADNHPHPSPSSVDRWCELMLDALTRQFDTSDSNLFHMVGYDEEEQHSQTGPWTNSERPCDWSRHTLPSRCILQRILSVQKLQTVDFQTVLSRYEAEVRRRGDYSYVDELFSLNNPLDDVQRYLLSATAKDCSIFIALQRNDNLDHRSPFYISDLDGLAYKLNIGISDIDPKPLSCIGKHSRRNELVASAAVQFFK